MTKEEKMIQIVEENLFKCVKSTSATIYTYGSIPYKVLEGAYNKYLNVDYDEKVIGLIDTTVFGSGKNGAAFTTKGFYMKDIASNPIYAEYDSWFNVNTNLDSVYYDFVEIADLMMKLSSVEDDNIWNDAAEEIGGIVKDTVINKFIDEMDEYNRQEREGMAELAELLDTCQEMFNSLYTELSDLISEEIDVRSDELDDLINAALSYNAVFFENEKVDEYFKEEYVEQMNELAQGYTACVDFLCELDNEKGFALKKATKKYSRQIKKIVRDFYKEDKITAFEAYDNCKNTIINLNSKLKDAINYIDEILDEYYDDED